MLLKNFLAVCFFKSAYAQITLTNEPPKTEIKSTTLTTDGTISNVLPYCYNKLKENLCNNDLPVQKNWTFSVSSRDGSLGSAVSASIWHYPPSQPNPTVNSNWSAMMTDLYGNTYFISQIITIPQNMTNSTFGVYFYTTLLNGGGKYVALVESADLNVTVTGLSSGKSASDKRTVTGTAWSQQKVYFEIGNGNQKWSYTPQKSGY